VLDEGDRLLDMGFRPVIDRIAGACPPQRQTLLFSATLDGVTGEVAGRYTAEAIDQEHSEPGRYDPARVEHRFVGVGDGQRLPALVEELGGERDRAIVCVRTKRGADRLVKRLDAHAVKVVSIHGDSSQGQRDRARSRFQSGQVDTRVVTNVAAREIDVDGVSHLVNSTPQPTSTPTSTESGARDALAIAAWE
jgi:ATP-dependent RNA helicase RhlE